MTELLIERDTIDFGDVPEEVNALLQQGVVTYRTDPVQADALFRQALAAAPEQLAVYFCLYKIHTYQGSLDEALAIAELGLQEAARQAGWGPDWHKWRAQGAYSDGPGRHALYTLKALAFIHLRRNEPAKAEAVLGKLAELDSAGVIGWHVVAALAAGVA